ncbi:GntR family transcriptional regulator [Kribbella sandramycini]|uniref:GntR family transcriptional regulator n=1 Tax=Kribbella sandramycini TaxID=60450 RepID=A0A841S5Y2_9ACTN|nr:GntR family transcriptional regulator [Kribbella sandramycini]
MPEGLKHERVAAVLDREVRAGLVRRGARLPGEVELARRFGVSRNTVRAALAILAREGLISTRSGKGSFAAFDGRPLDGRLGWTHAPADPVLDVESRTIRIAHERTSHRSLSTEKLIVIERLQLVGDTPIAWERSWVPALEPLRDLPRKGLVNDSIAVTLTRAGLHPDHCSQRLRTRPLTPAEAATLARSPGVPFLHTERTSWTADDRFAEHAECLLDPAHYELTLDYGTA